MRSLGRVGAIEIGRVLEVAAESRCAPLEYCAAENVLLLPGHFEAPHVGRIQRAGNTLAINFGC